ncbi:MAG: hypothetical protein H3C27_01075 [Opitutaceae bacterium]|nr:hypothetical protein [Opitutaceae bacterium]
MKTQHRRLVTIASALDLTPAQLAVGMVFQGFDAWCSDIAAPDAESFMEAHPERMDYIHGLATRWNDELNSDLASAIAARCLIDEVNETETQA